MSSVLRTNRIARGRALGRAAMILFVAALLAGCANSQAGGSRQGSLPSPFVPPTAWPTMNPTAPPTAWPTMNPTAPPTAWPTMKPTAWPTVKPTVRPLIPALTLPGLSLLAGPVDVPLELRIPSLQISAPVIGVGITSESVMDAPRGPLDDPVWQTVFWYRGSGIPGDSGTATFAGHVNGLFGRPAVFARINELQPGDAIIVHDTRSGRDVLFLVVATAIYSLRQAAEPSVLVQVYGAGPVAGIGPQPAPDGLSHLTLVTCTGDFVAGSFDHRLVVYATQVK